MIVLLEYVISPVHFDEMLYLCHCIMQPDYLTTADNIYLILALDCILVHGML